MKKTITLFILAAFFMLPPVIARAGETFGTDTPGKNALDTSDALKKLAVSTLVVVVLGVAAIYLTKKVMPRVSAAMGKELKIVESMSLGPRRQLYVIKVGARKLLIGGASESITFLADVTEALGEHGKSQQGAQNE